MAIVYIIDEHTRLEEGAWPTLGQKAVFERVKVELQVDLRLLLMFFLFASAVDPCIA